MLTITPGTPTFPPEKIHSELAQWLLHGLNELIRYSQTGLEKHRLSDVLESLRSFFWGEFCDWYLEMDKKRNRTDEDNQVLAYCYSTLLKLMHPYVPFVTEALWEQFQQPKMLAVSDWPQEESYSFPEAHSRIELIREAISQIRTLREKANIGLDKKIGAKLDSEKNAVLFRKHRDLIIRMARLSDIEINEKAPDSSRDTLGAYFNDTLVFIEAAAVDWKKEIESLKKRLKTESGFVEKSRKKLSNPGFLKQAPENVVSELQEKVSSTEKTLEALKLQIKELEKLVE